MSRSVRLIISGFGLVMALFTWRTVGAAPVSGPNVASGTTIYDGVIAIAPAETPLGIMELGANGTDIATSGTLTFRPNRLLTYGDQFVKNATTGKVDLLAYGGFCLGGQCRDTWATGSGTSLWTLVGTQYLQPATLSQGLSFTKTTTTGGPALEVLGSNATPGSAVAYLSNASTNIFANAIVVNGPAPTYLGGKLQVSFSGGGSEVILRGGICIGGPYDGYRCTPGLNECGATGTCSNVNAKVWNAQNDGATSGLDASKLDGHPLEFDYDFVGNTACQRAQQTGTGHCLCDISDLCIDLQ